jgi:hypothetical protein
MGDYEDGYFEEEEEKEKRPYDQAQGKVKKELEELFGTRPSEVFFSRQLEVKFEKNFFHWITNRAIHELEDEGQIVCERRPIGTGSSIVLAFNKAHRYYKRDAQRICELVEEYSQPTVGREVGRNGEALVLNGFARNQFVMQGQETREFNGKKWRSTEHDLDFIFSKDGIDYGVEVKNTLTYMNYKEMKIKMRICKKLGIRPVFVARMMPGHWINEVNGEGGYSLILKYQLYPLAFERLAKRLREELELPVDTPRALDDGTMRRFMKWHVKNL